MISGALRWVLIVNICYIFGIIVFDIKDSTAIIHLSSVHCALIVQTIGVQSIFSTLLNVMILEDFRRILTNYKRSGRVNSGNLSGITDFNIKIVQLLYI